MKKCERKSYPNTKTQSSISPALYTQLLVNMDVEVFIDSWLQVIDALLQDAVTHLRKLINFNAPLSSNKAVYWHLA